MAKGKTAAVTKKTECPITKKDWAEADQKAAIAKLRQKLMDELPIEARTFSSGSVGYGSSGKITLPIGGVPVKLQVSLNVVVVGSKEAGLGTESGAEVPASEAA